MTIDRRKFIKSMGLGLTTMSLNAKNLVNISFWFDPHISFETGRPIFFAIQPAKMFPKLPVGTEKAIS